MIGDSVTMKYLAMKECHLTTLKEIFNTVYFGFVLPKRGPKRGAGSNASLFRAHENISNAIISLGSRGELTNLYEKWWPQEK